MLRFLINASFIYKVPPIGGGIYVTIYENTSGSKIGLSTLWNNYCFFSYGITVMLLVSNGNIAYKFVVCFFKAVITVS